MVLAVRIRQDVAMEPDITCDVLVVGAGPVGLCAAIDLRRRGVACTVVERHAGTLDFPKGRLITTRTMELFRSWGIDEAMEAVGLPRDASLFVFAGESLLAPEFRRTGLPVPPRDNVVSPTQRLLCDQMAMEEVLLDHARALGADVRFVTALEHLDHDDDGVTATLLDQVTGRPSVVRCAFAIGADGAGSDIRSGLGIERSGAGRQGGAASIYFRAPLGERMAGRTAGRYDLAAIPGASVMVVDNDQRWMLIAGRDPAADPDDRYVEAWALELARRAIGDPAVPVEIVGIRLWESVTLVADRFRSGRVFLVGDAAHVTTPVGGLGMNCGLADVHDLCWKLAAVLAGWAHPDLLDTYEPERHPVAVATAHASTGPARPPAPAEGIVLGTTYRSDAITPDGTEPPAVADPVNDLVPTAHPGRRAPHVWLDSDCTRSTLDLFGGDFVVMAGPDARPHAEAALGDPAVANIPVRLETPDGGAWRSAYGIDKGGAVLVRPDGHVAARQATLERPAALVAALLRAAGSLGPGNQSHR